VGSCDFQAGDLGTTHSFVSLDQGGVRLVAVKEAQDGEGLILRLVEVDGRDAEVRLALDPQLVGAGARATVVDAMERPVEGGQAELRDGELRVSLPAGGILAVRLGT